MPQRTVQRSVRELVNSLKLVGESNNTLSHPDVNWGKPLPLGTNLLTVLQNVAKEEEELALNSTTTSTTEKLVSSNVNTKKMKRDSNSKGGNDNTVTNEELLQANALIKILLKIPPNEVRKLRENAYAISHYYRFYEFNLSLSHSSPPLTAMYTFPSGGGIEMMDRYLNHRKKVGVEAVWTQCQVSYTIYRLMIPCLVCITSNQLLI